MHKRIFRVTVTLTNQIRHDIMSATENDKRAQSNCCYRDQFDKFHCHQT